MQQAYLTLLAKNVLFSGINPADFKALFGCLDARVTAAAKGSFVVTAGDKVEHIGIVLDGRLQIVRENYEGDRDLLAVLLPGELFAETLCCAGVDESPVSVIADSDAHVLLLAYQRMLRNCSNACPFHNRLLANMLQVIAKKNLYLQKRMEIIGMKTLRERVLGYLQSVGGKQKQDFAIPFNREQLSEYLCVDRSALSRELSRMKAEGLIDYWKNRFRLL